MLLLSLVFFFFIDTPTTEIYTLSLHDALPICVVCDWFHVRAVESWCRHQGARLRRWNCGSHVVRVVRSSPVSHPDRKSTRLNSSHSQISYAVFCLKKKNKKYLHYLTNLPNNQS